MIVNPHMLPKVRSRALLSAVAGMPCTLRLGTFLALPCVPGTVVPCHLPVFGKGIGTKVSDLYVVAGCHLCHDLLDGRDPRGLSIRERYPHAFHERLTAALCETLGRWVAAGVLAVEGAEIV